LFSGGAKIVTADTALAKLTPDAVDALAKKGRRGVHHVKARALSITQATELGTVYTPEETRAIADAAHELGMHLHIDGARLANAAASMDMPLRALTTDLGVDVLSFGGTKNGLVLGDAVVFLRPELAETFLFTRKQLGQLASKMRFLAVQFDALLEGDLWSANASHANAMARRLADAVSKLDGARIAYPVEANGVFVTLPADAIERLREALPASLPFYVWEEAAGTIPLMCSWDTSEDDVDGLVAALAEAL
jgi:threonine aldolase